ncbi:MAG: SBBP repeat-containing protein [Ignavibacteria bacterium]|nr:SBBP repeat-containing protein [Ignavibacteria bacterium]
MKYLCLLIFTLLLTMNPVNSYCQVNREWTSYFNSSSNDNDEVSSMTVDVSGNVYVTGYSIVNGNDKDFITIKYNSAGVSQWTSRYNNPAMNDDDEAISLTTDDLGNVYVTGFSKGNGTFKDYLTVKYSPSGNELWTARYNGTGNDDDIAVSVEVTNSGNVIVSGTSVGDLTSEDYLTIMYNSNGAEQWTARYNYDLVDDIEIAKSMTVDGFGNVYVTGFSYGLSKNEDYAVVKYNSAGTEQWVARYNGPSDSYDISTDIITDISGNVYVTGYSYDNVSLEDYATIKYNSSGEQQWVSKYNGASGKFDIANSITTDNAGNVFVTGYSYDVNSSEDYATVKYNSAGGQQWVSLYNGSGNDFDIATSIKSDVNGNVYVAGYSYGSGTQEDFATVKYNSNGDQQWAEIFNGDADSSDIAASLAIDQSGNIYTSGYSYVTSSGFDFITIKYSQTVGVNQISGNLPEKFLLEQNYPNPFNPNTNIRYTIEEAGYTSLTVYNSVGIELSTLISENLQAGSYSAEFNAENYPSGVYYYKLTSGDFTQVKKMILLK